MSQSARAIADHIRDASGDPTHAGRIIQQNLDKLDYNELISARSYASSETDPVLAFDAFVRGLLIGHPERLPARPSVNWQFELVGEWIERCGRERPPADSKPSGLTPIATVPTQTDRRDIERRLILLIESGEQPQTQAEYARRFGCSPSVISKVKRGSVRIRNWLNRVNAEASRQIDDYAVDDTDPNAEIAKLAAEQAAELCTDERRSRERSRTRKRVS